MHSYDIGKKSIHKELFAQWLLNHISEPENTHDSSFGEIHIISR